MTKGKDAFSKNSVIFIFIFEIRSYKSYFSFFIFFVWLLLLHWAHLLFLHNSKETFFIQPTGMKKAPLALTVSRRDSRWTASLLPRLTPWLRSHHVAECHHSQQRLAARLDSSQGKRPQQLLQQAQHVEGGGVLLVACREGGGVHRNGQIIIKGTKNLLGVFCAGGRPHLRLALFPWRRTWLWWRQRGGGRGRCPWRGSRSLWGSRRRPAERLYAPGQDKRSVLNLGRCKTCH